MPNIFVRINDVITANLNDIIDRVEDPERMIKQIIREMDDNIAQAKEGVLDAIASEKRLHKELEHHRSQAQDWLAKAEDALRADNEPLARMALTRKKEHDDIAKGIEPSWAAANNTSDRLKAQLHALEAKLDEAKRKRSTLVARQRAAQARQQLDRTLTTLRNGVDADAKFARMEDRVAEMEAQTEALDELQDDSAPLEREFRDMEVQVEVDRELDALKRHMSEGSQD